MKTLKPQVVIVTAIIIVFSFLFWMGLFLGYVADAWILTPADDRSVPAAKTY
jgi:uncharacterized membrane protein (DUF106 family)